MQVAALQALKVAGRRLCRHSKFKVAALGALKVTALQALKVAALGALKVQGRSAALGALEVPHRCLKHE